MSVFDRAGDWLERRGRLQPQERALYRQILLPAAGGEPPARDAVAALAGGVGIDAGDRHREESISDLCCPVANFSSNHLACLRWCGFVTARRERRVVYNRIADERVIEMLDQGHALLADNEEHVAACCWIEDR